MTLHVSLTPNTTTHSITVDVYDDLNITDEDWNKMNPEEQEEKLNDLVCELSEQPFWMVDKFKENSSNTNKP